MSNSSQSQPLPSGTLVTLLFSIPGHAHNDAGIYVPHNLARGTQVCIFDSIQQERQTTPTCLSGPIYDYVYSFTKVMGSNYMTPYYPGDDVKNSETIPHTILSSTPDGAPETAFYHTGRVLFLLEPYEYLSSTLVKQHLEKGAKIIVNSNLRKTRTGGSSGNPFDALYCFQKAKSNEEPRLWVSDYYYSNRGSFSTYIPELL